MSEEKKDKEEFTVRDRRLFTESGQPRQETDGQPDQPPPDEPQPESQTSGAETAEHEQPSQMPPLPEVSFSTFVISLNSEALFHLGIIGNPTTGEQEKNLGLAKHTIDTLGMLEEKTRGNLTEDEAAMLKNLLYDLRMIYVRETS